MSEHYRYLAIDDPNQSEGTDGQWAHDLTEALALAQDMAEETGVHHIIMEWVATIDPPGGPLPLEEVYCVEPGRDFPATL